jgi:DedD protein
VSDFPASDIDDLEIKKRARRRLVGATVLALLAVIVLPQVVRNSDEPRTASDIQVTIPERGEFEVPPVVAENNPESARVAIEPDAATGAPEFPIELPSSLPEASLPLPNRSVPSSPAQVPSVAQPPAPAHPAPSVAQPSRKPRHENVPSQPKSAAQDAEAERALALLNGTAPVKEPDQGGKAGKGKVFVQVMAFSGADRDAKAAKQVAELKKQGYSAYAEKSGKVTRVRVGPLPRNEGERVLARMKAQGRKAMLSSR